MLQEQVNTLFTEPLPQTSTATDVVTSFIQDYETWNTFANQNENEKEEVNWWNIGKAYDNLILKYCGPEKKYQPLAYGSRSHHSPAEESIVEEDISANQATVITNCKNTSVTFESIDVYKYTLVQKHDRWLLEEVYFVDDQGVETACL